MREPIALDHQGPVLGASQADHSFGAVFVDESDTLHAANAN